MPAGEDPAAHKFAYKKAAILVLRPGWRPFFMWYVGSAGITWIQAHGMTKYGMKWRGFVGMQHFFNREI